MALSAKASALRCVSNGRIRAAMLPGVNSDLQKHESSRRFVQNETGTGTDLCYRGLSLMRMRAVCAVQRLFRVLRMLSVCCNFYTPGVMIFIL
jgi:hypothetical protein